MGRVSPTDSYGRSVIWSDFQALWPERLVLVDSPLSDSDHPRLAIPPDPLELGAPFKPLSWIFRLRLLGGYRHASSNHDGPGENGCHQLPIRRALSRLVLGFKQSSLHRVKIALRNPSACWSLRFPFSCHALVHSQSFDFEVRRLRTHHSHRWEGL